MMFHWPTFFIIIYGLLFCLVVCGQFTSCKGTTAQDSPACTASLGYITGDLLLSEKTIGYLPYKPTENESFDGSAKRHLSRGLDYQRGAKAMQESGDLKPMCAAGKKACSDLGHPEICCEESHSCLPTNNTLTGTYCCGSPDPVNQPCNDEKLSCEDGWYECPASANGGCCKYGQRCHLLQCLEGGGPARPTASLSQVTPAPSDPDLDGDGVRGTQDNTSAMRTTIPYSASQPSITPGPKNGITNGTDDDLYRITGVLSSTAPPTPFTPRPTFNPGPPSLTKPLSNIPTTNGRSGGMQNSFQFHGWIIAVIMGWIAIVAGGS
ncbi:hypothetical protein L873DRAFT_1788446 [Choiromyces venosus 120613-1]|uniref:Uncharacterized protein n=1 Tax=Choiromyces venosus 120613-1 TaxID=1336337 RepID=A0A3N4JVC2_9PEZI|nr:hypothetical protein L873DRAFT_1788446 [Choiromyces venosus 120613-1]